MRGLGRQNPRWPQLVTLMQTFHLKTPALEKRAMPAVLTIAGSDSSGGAGIEADLKTFSAHKVYGLTCITALTAQNTLGVSRVEKTPKVHVEAILNKNFEDFVDGHETPQLKAIKTGMLTEEAAKVLSERVDYISSNKIALVVDPVMVSTSGATLTENSTVTLCFDRIFPNLLLCTPNFLEAQHLYEAKLGKTPTASSVEDISALAKELCHAIGCQNILVKGGHVPQSSNGAQEVVDVLYEKENDKTTLFRSSFIDSKNTHGTGCTLASAIAANVANGHDLVTSVALAINFVRTAMLSVELGHGNGPLDHSVVAEQRLGAVTTGKVEINNVVDYLTSHVRVKTNWERYVQHPFLHQLATNQLPFDRFLFFLKQDFYYLIVYARIHGVAASVAPTVEQIASEVKTIDNVMKELDRHKEKLWKKYQIDYSRTDLDAELQPAKSCQDYCDYLMKIAKSEDYLGIKVALAACLHGYAEAGHYGQKIRAQHDGSLGKLSSEESETYSQWLNDYTSDWYTDADQTGKKALDDIFKETEVSQERLDELVGIFNDVVLLEVGFWDAVIA